ncbi:MAG: peptidase dimerization protein, partial [bacterium]
MNKVKTSVEPNFENALSFASDLIRIPSLSGQEREVAKRLWDEMEALGFEQMKVDEVGNVMGVIPGEGQAPPIMFNCHLDVVAEGDHSEWD